MTQPPLPASNCVRCKLDYTQTDNVLGGSRFYLAFTGTAPTAANCSTLASHIATAWGNELASLVHQSWTLTEVDVQDISSLTGASGNWTGSSGGSESGAECPANAAQNIEFGITRRYRGGKPRMYLPPSGAANLQDASHWTSAQQSALQTNIAAFFAAITGTAVGGMGTMSHVNLSYYSGFKNITNSSGRTRAVPQYRDTALVDPVTNYIVRTLVGSQRRRRSAVSY